MTINITIAVWTLVALSSTLFTLLYALRSPWYVSQLGSAYLGLSLVYTTVLITHLAYFFLSMGQVDHWVSFIEGVFLLIATSNMTYHLLRLQKKADTEYKNE